MKVPDGTPFSLAKSNPAIKGCTVSEEIFQAEGSAVTIFSMDAHTDISAESYENPKLLLVAEGALTVYTKDWRKTLKPGQGLSAPTGIPVGMEAETNAVYIEISLRRNAPMNHQIEAGEVFTLAELVPYADGKIVNMDVIREPHMKYVLMSFDAGTGLTEHAAPGEALLFALEGEGIIGYEGKEYSLRAGENFKFAKNGKHWVRADSRFKMALLMTLE